ncbi:unnamed protein product, partial [Musa banksii]
EAGFLESYTLNVPHPPNNSNLQSLRSNLYPISELARLILCSFGTYHMSVCR